jgi:hypothetical protein
MRLIVGLRRAILEERSGALANPDYHAGENFQYRKIFVFRDNRVGPRRLPCTSA